MPNRSNLNSLILPVFAIFLLNGCVTIYNPATKKKETLLIDTRSEVSMGSDMDQEIEKKLKISEDPVMMVRLGSIGARIAAVSDRQDLNYYFRIVKDKELNAFSIPGGYVYVNTGLMNIATDDELACVVAHEIGHIAARHSVKKLQATLGYQIIASIALGASGNVDMSRAMDMVFSLASLGYGRNDELLADRLAVRYSKRAGFSSYAMVTFFEKLKKEEERRGSGSPLVFLSSHPPIDERIAKVKEEIALNH